MGQDSQEFDEAGSDVIASEALRGSNVSSTTVIDNASHSITDFLLGRLLRATSEDLIVAPGDGFLGSHAVPEAVTGKEDELAGGVNWLNFNIGEGSHSLILRLHAAVALVLEVTKSTRESKSSIDTSIFNEAVGVVDAFALLSIIRLVIVGQLHGHFTLTKDGAGVTSISAVDLSRGDDDTSSCAASIGLVVAVVKLGDLLLTSRSEHHLVHLEEDFL